MDYRFALGPHDQEIGPLCFTLSAQQQAGRIRMNERLRDVWLPGCCFVVALGTALLLGVAVLIAPWLASGDNDHPVLALFAHDATVRRTSIAGALGLAATSFIFFRPAGWFRKRDANSDTPSSIAGA